MDDLISRQAAIDAIDVKNVNKGIISALQSIIEELPSAQPEVTAEMVDSYVKPRYLRVISEEFYMHLTAGKYLPPPIFQPTQPERKKGEMKYCSDCGRKVNWDG